MKNSIVVELALGKVKPGVNREDYLQAAVAIEEDLRRMPGFISRRILVGEDGMWVDLIYWNNLEVFLRAAEEFQNIASAQTLFGLLDPGANRMYHLEQVYEDILAETSRA